MTERVRSHWGWGWADRFAGREEREGLVRFVQAMLGAGELRVDDPVPLDRARLPAPRLVPPSSLAAFSAADPHGRALHTYGRGYRDIVRGFRGDFGPAPDFVALPRSEAEVAAVLDWAQDARVAVVPYGGGTSVVGGVEAVLEGDLRGVVSLDLGRLDRLLDVDAASCAARIEAGASGPVIDARLAPHGFTLRHYPQSYELATLGGMLATRSGGHWATLFTHIDELVESIRMLTPRGPWETRRLPSSGAGPSPDRLVLGSEGTLGVITSAWMRVQRRPAFRSRASVRFDRFDDGVAACRAVAQSGLFPSNCRLLDDREALLAGVPADGASVLLLGFESADHPLEPAMARALELCADFRGTCPDGPKHRAGSGGEGDPASASWRQAFLEAPYLQTNLVSAGVIADTFETCCTWDRFAALHDALETELPRVMRGIGGAGALTCRFTYVYGDGPAPYYTFITPARHGAELEAWAEIKTAASEILASHGATITHHHAVGRVHRPWYERERPALFGAALAAVKRELDPAGVMNPGVLLEVGGGGPGRAAPG